MITETTAKDTPAVVSINVNSDNSQSKDIRQSMNDGDTVDDGNKTELLCTGVNLLLKVPVINNTHNTTHNLFQDFLVQIQQSDQHTTLLPRYSSNKNYSSVPIKRPEDVSKDFQALQTYSPCLNTKHNTNQQPEYSSI